MIHLINLVFILAFLAFAHFVDGKVTRTLKKELKEVENAQGDLRFFFCGKKMGP